MSETLKPDSDTPVAPQSTTVSAPAHPANAKQTMTPMSMTNSDPKKSAFLTATEAAHWLGLKPNTLAKMRVAGNGPVYRKHGQRVLYALEDLQTWSDARRRGSTSEDPDD